MRSYAEYKSAVSPLALNEKNFPKVVTVLDSSIAASTTPFAVHALTSVKTVFLSGKDIVSYLQSLETSDVKIHEIDFDALKAESDAPTASSTGGVGAKPKAAAQDKSTKDDAKIEGAVQIAIGVKKEVDFATWYTNVCFRFIVLSFRRSRRYGRY